MATSTIYIPRMAYGDFTVACAAGQNNITSSSSLVRGNLPVGNYAGYTFRVVNHGTVANSPNTVEVDGGNTIIVNAKTAQNITVAWTKI